jgi:hypothetical protein
MPITGPTTCSFDDLTREAPIVVVDWQLAMWGLGAYDVARLAGGSIPRAERGGHHEEIVACWHQGLLAGGVTGYSYEEAWHDYRLSAIVATLNPVLVHYLLTTGGARGTALGAAMSRRFSATWWNAARKQWCLDGAVLVRVCCPTVL